MLHRGPPPQPYYTRNAWRTDFGGDKNRALARGPKNAATRLQAQKELLRLRKEARLFRLCPNADTPVAVAAEEFLASYAGRPAFQDFSNELHWFMGLDQASDPDELP